MNIFIIAQIMQGKKVVGYRLLDTDANNQINDYPIQNISAVLSNPNTANLIRNAKMVNGEIIGTNGQLSRYAKIDTQGNLLSNDSSPLVVINKIGDVGYTVSDFKGFVKKIRNAEAVNYAKNRGIANGKVVVQDYVEYISSIADSYDQIKISPSKTGTKGKVDLKIHIDNDARSIAKHTENDLDNELQYNDVFSAMTPEQRAVLKQYYTWYTVDVYKGLAKNVRLNLAPGKAEKLAQLRGIDKWQFAGVNDSYLEGRFDAKCELGHSLRYEYFAIPESEAEKTSARTRDWKNYAFRTTKGTQDELKDNGAIVFGETCASDFFNIAPEDMKKLVKTRKTMSSEIELIADIITNNTEQLFMDKCSFLYESIKRMGNAQTVIKVFGQQVGYTLLSFMKEAIPFPKSLIILAGDMIRKDKKQFFNSIIQGKEKAFDEIFKDIPSSEAVRMARVMLDYVASYTVEGDYQYNPIRDKDCSRRDIGAYNKETRNQREYELRRIFAGTTLSEAGMESIDKIEMYISLVDFCVDAVKEVERSISDFKYIDKKFSGVQANRLNKSIQLFVELEYDKVDIDELSRFDILSSILSFSNCYNKSNLFNCRTQTYVSKYRSHRQYQSTDELYDVFNAVVIGKDIKQFLELTLGKYNDSLEAEVQKQLEEELNKPEYVKITLIEGSESAQLVNNVPFVLATLRKEGKLLMKKFNNKETTGEEELKIYKYSYDSHDSIKLKDMKTLDFIDESQYNKELYDFSLESMRKEREKKLKEEQERQERLKKEREEQERLEKERKESEEKQIKEEFDNDEKMKKLKELLEANKNVTDYGLDVARSILAKERPFSKLTSKQQWRVNETIKQLGGEVSQDEQAAPTKQKLEDSPEILEKVTKLLEILSTKDKANIERVNKASRIAFDIAKTVKYKGEFSDKQLNHINKAYDAIV